MAENKFLKDNELLEVVSQVCSRKEDNPYNLTILSKTANDSVTSDDESNTIC